MRTGIVEANLVVLNGTFRLAHVTELVTRKLAGAEQSSLNDADVSFHRSEYARLLNVLEEAGASSALPDAPTAEAALNDLLLRVRLTTIETLGTPRSTALRAPARRA